MDSLPKLEHGTTTGYNMKNGYYYKLTRNKRYIYRITITGGKNIIGMLLGKDRINLGTFKYNIKYQIKDDYKSIIIVEGLYYKCVKCNSLKIICSNMDNFVCNHKDCKFINKLNIDIENFKCRLYKKYKRICKNKGIRYENRIKEENMFEFNYEIKHRILFDFYIHPKHIRFIKGKKGKYLDYLRSIYNCELYIHKNKNSNLVKYKYGRNYSFRSNYKYLFNSIKSTKLCVKINPLYMYHFLIFITTNILQKAQNTIYKNLYKYNPISNKNISYLNRYYR